MSKTSSATKQTAQYLAFFGLYAVLLYVLLYQANGLNPFQYNHHFFSNAVGSYSKRLLGDTLPYALLFFLTAHTKKRAPRVFYLSLFMLIFLINVVSALYYFNIRSNFQWYVLEAFTWPAFFSYFTLPLTLGLAVMFLALAGFVILLMRTKPRRFRWPKPYPLLTALIPFLFFLQAYITPILYDLNVSIMNGDTLQKKVVRLSQLEESGVQRLLAEIRQTYFPPKVEAKVLTVDEEKTIASLGLEQKSTQTFENPPKKIVLIVAESLNSDFLSYYNDQIPAVSPTIDGLLSQYPHVDDFYPSGPFTIHGLSAMLCGHTNMNYGRKLSAHVCVPELLKDAGFHTEFIRGVSKYYIGENLAFSKFGFERIIGKEDMDLLYPDFASTRPADYKTWGYTDNFVFDTALDRLRNSPEAEKLFLTLLGVDTHVPGGRCYDERHPAPSEDPVLYSVSCFDQYVSDFLNGLKEAGLMDENVLILLTSDQLYPAFTGIPGDSFSTSFKLEPARIPLLMVTKYPLKIMTQRGSQVDIASSLLDLHNIETPDYYMGRSLFSNSVTFPVGQDGVNGFVMIGESFFPLSPWSEDPVKNEPVQGFFLSDNRGGLDEIVANADLKQEEIRSGYLGSLAVSKWYYNRYFIHELE